MKDSRGLYDLHDRVAKRAAVFIESCKKEGIVLLVTSTYRDVEKQDQMYLVGRRGVIGERIVTCARGGESYHQYRCALDVVPLVYGKPIWESNKELWKKIGAIGEASGLEWAGRWTGRMREFCHFQYTGGLSLAELKAGKDIV